jgi:hypothetical protein
MPQLEQFEEIPGTVLGALLDHILQRATQNHKLHQDWNEGAGDFKDCTRGDCTESRKHLEPWGWI